MIRAWLHSRRTAAVKREAAAWHLAEAARYEAQAGAMLDAQRQLPIGAPMRFALHLGRTALASRADAARARAGGDFNMAAEHEAEATWFAARHRASAVMAGMRVCEGVVVA